MNEPPFQRVSWWIPVAFGLVGFLIGFVAGLSLTPIVGTLLPLLFGVIGGGSGFFAAQKPVLSRAIGLSVAVLACFCLLGLVYGIHLRQGISWHCTFSACAEPKLELPRDVTDQNCLDGLFSIKTILLSMDADPEDKQRFFSMAVEVARQGRCVDDPLLPVIEDGLFDAAEMQAKLKRGPGTDGNTRPALKKK